MSFGESVIKIRTAKGISRKDFAEQLKIPYTTLRNYETEQREPGHKLLIKMATILNVSVDDLVDHHPNKNMLSYSSEARQLAKDYDALDEHGKKIVRLVIDEETFRMSTALKTYLIQTEGTEVPKEQKTPAPVSEDGLNDEEKSFMASVMKMSPVQQEAFFEHYNQLRMMKEPQKDASTVSVPSSVGDKAPESELPNQS